MDHVQHAIQQHGHIQNRMHDEQHQRMNHGSLQRAMGQTEASGGTDGAISPGEAMFLTASGVAGGATGGVAGLLAGARHHQNKEYADSIGQVFRSADDVLQGGPVPANFADEFARVKQNIDRAHSSFPTTLHKNPGAIVGGSLAGLALGAGVGYAPIALRRMSEQRQSLDGQRENMNKTASTFF